MFIKIFFIALPIFFAVDMLWLGVIAKSLYRQQIGFLLRPDVNWFAAIIFYIIFIIGLVVFVIEPSLSEKRSVIQAIAYAAFFGFVTYATYDLTNLATLKDWPISITIIDLAWGATLASIVATTTIFVYQKFFG